MKSYLFCFTVGPVKEFIGHSRKSQDLFAASTLLSYLTRIAIDKAIIDFNQGKDIIIMPKLTNRFIPNIFVALIEDKGFNLEDIGNGIECEVKRRFREVSMLPFNNTFQAPNGYLNQVDNYLEVFWLYNEIENGDYKKAYIQLFDNLNYIKSLNAFSTYEEKGRKCSIDGYNNVKVYRLSNNESLNPSSNLSKLYQPISDVKILMKKDYNYLKIWHIQESEGLSAISLTKRIFNNSNPSSLSDPHLFPSTVKVALYNWIAKIKHLQEYDDFKIKIIGDTKNTQDRIFDHSNDELYFKENIDQLDDISEEVRQQCLECYNILHTKIQSEEITEPKTKYYALIRFDGDKVGEILAGNFLKPGQDLKAFHIKLTDAIGNFANNIAQYIAEPKGAVIYAGGEDFMAMINLHYLFKVLNEIQKSYDDFINLALTSDLINNSKLTISLGVAIAHYKQPINMVLDLAKSMELKSKNNGRNRFSIGVHKHSGNYLDACFLWSNSTTNTLIILQDIYFLLLNKKFSCSFLLNLYNAFEKYGFSMNEEIVVSKINLYVPRSSVDGNEININKMKSLINTLYELSKDNPQDFCHMLLILDFFIRKSESD